jgi:tricorn protease
MKRGSFHSLARERIKYMRFFPFSSVFDSVTDEHANAAAAAQKATAQSDFQRESHNRNIRVCESAETRSKREHWPSLGSLICVLSLFIGFPTTVLANTPAALMRFPNSYGGKIVFEARNNLWVVPSTGGTASRLTSDPGRDFAPRFSPNGRWIAYVGSYDGKQEVFVIPSSGGEARRLTTQAQVKLVVAWTRDSRSVVFLSNRQGWNDRVVQVFSVPLDGGLPQLLPLDRAGTMSYGPDGHTIAYNRIFNNFSTWKRYEGGLAPDVYTYDLLSKHLERITDWRGTDTFPMWVGRKIYFLSDRDEHRRANVWVYDLDTRTSRAVTHFSDYDIDFPSYGDGEITFQQGGKLWSLALPSEQLHEVNVTVPDDGARTMHRIASVKSLVREWDSDYDIDYSLSADGRSALFSARGEIFAVAKGGDVIRNLTQTSSADEDHPAWSPDGQKVAYTTDGSGEQQLAVRPAHGGPEVLLTHFVNGFLYAPVWSPRGDQIAIHDGAHRLWLVPTGGGEPKLVAYNRGHYMHETDEHDAAFSPDGRWLAYSVSRATRLRALHLYEVATGKDVEISSPMESDYRPAFSSDGDLLFFVSDRHENPVLSDRETNAITLKSGGIFVTTLSSHGTNPFALSPDGDREESAAGVERTSVTAHATPTEIDFDGLMQRAVALPIEPNKIDGLEVRQNRILYHTMPPSLVEGSFPGEKATLHVYDLTSRADQVVAEDIDTFRISADGARVLFNRQDHWVIADAQGGAPHQTELHLEDMRVRVDPRQEWAEMFENSWRLERDLYVNANMNGDDWGAVHDSYARMLPLLGSREDLNYLIGEVVGEIASSHARSGGGDMGNEPPAARCSYLGADYKLDPSSRRYQFGRIYPGDNTRELYRSPLTWPGVNVREGDYLLAINGRELKAPDTPDSLLEGASGRVLLTIASSPSGERHTTMVDPIASEIRLRELFWINNTRERVSALSNGRIGYIHMSDMEGLGMQQFVQQFYPQLEKEALIIDDRWNPGGNVDEMVLERLRRVLSSMQTGRDRVPQTQPDQIMTGPKVMLTNQDSASDGDVFPFHFRAYGLGELIGTRTWGGVRGLRTRWPLLDGGWVVVPEITFYDLAGHWAVENRGMEPDVVVEDVPGEFLENHDIQLETAVQRILEKIGPKRKDMLMPPPDVPIYAPGGEAPPSYQPQSNLCAARGEVGTLAYPAVHVRSEVSCSTTNP